MNQLLAWGMEPRASLMLSKLSLLLLMAFGSWAAYRLLARLVIGSLSRIIVRSKTQWDDLLLKNRVLERAGWIVPALVVHSFAHTFDSIDELLRRTALIWMLLVIFSVISALLNTATDIYNSFEVARNRPIRGYVQVAKIVLFIYAGALVLSLILGKSPLTLLSGLGAMTAVLLLIFKDSILGLVAGVQLTSNDMVRIGDWIQMDAFEADGTVIDISLHTV
ncbi:MAG: mechanosensitive ion channel family protein, partial [Candidatus Cloacimonetes bacterium]|nr:mechanosensitive ion channel family protein [Candidatus Cloacimonadota bacterium]